MFLIIFRGAILKNFIFILFAIAPISILVINPFFEYYWFLDNLLGLVSLFYFWYFILAIFVLFKMNKNKNENNTPHGFLFFSIVLFSIMINEKETYKNNELTTNIFSTFQYNMFNNSETVDDALKLIHDKKPDLLVFQEISDDMGVRLFEQLKKEYPHSIGRKPTEGFPNQQLLMSKMPLTNKKIHEYSNKKHRFISANISINNQSVYIYVMHPPSPKNKINWQERNFLLKEANLSLLEQNNPFLLIGDLNITKHSNQFHHIFDNENYNFNVLESGVSWRIGNIPVLSDYILSNVIDHSFTSKNINAINKKSYSDKKGSDHYPILSYFEIN